MARKKILMKLVIDELGDLTLSSKIPGWGLTPSNKFIEAFVNMLIKASETKTSFEAMDKEIEMIKKAVLNARNVHEGDQGNEGKAQ